MSIEVHSADTVSQVGAVLTGSAKYFAGGTLLMRQVNYGDQSIDRLVVSDDPVLKQIQSQGEQITIGAGATMSEIIRHPDLRFLSEVARSVGGPAGRNMATIGGNLFAPRPYGDMATALLALNANINWADGQQQPIEQLLEQQAGNSTPSGSGKVVTSVSLQIPARGAFKYLKVSRVKPKGVSLITLAANLHRENGRIGEASISFGGMAPMSRRARSAEQALHGASLDEAGIERCLSVCTEGMEPADDALASAWYRRQVAPVYLKRLLLERSEY